MSSAFSAVLVGHLNCENLTGDWTDVFVFDAFHVNHNSVRVSSKFAVAKGLLTKYAITENKK
jgi:hypothetical protein